MAKRDWNTPETPALPEREPLMRPSGVKAWHGLTGTRFFTPLPDSVKGPRSRQMPRDPSAPVVNRHRTPVLDDEHRAGQRRPVR